MNNIMPAWMLGAFSTAHNNYKEMRISLEEFVNQIEDLPEVPELVKHNWREILRKEQQNKG